MTDSDCVCFYKQPSNYLQNYFPMTPGAEETPQAFSALGAASSHSNETGYMLTIIHLWILIEAILTSGLIFIILCLSKFNRKEKYGKKMLQPILIKSGICFVLLLVLFWLLIFEFNIQLYFKFRDFNAMKFYLFWKFLGFVIIYEKQNSKKWLLDKLKIPNLHSMNIEWEETTKKLKSHLIQNASAELARSKIITDAEMRRRCCE